jgi:hypothetical protein
MSTQIREAVEELLPAHIMCVAIDKLYSAGYEIRLDTRGYLNNHMVKVLRAHPHCANAIASRTDSMADDIMRPVFFDDPKQVLLAASYLMLKLVDEKMYLDADNQAVLSALMITADADGDENPELHKIIGIAKQQAGKMFDECLRQGLYCHATIN